MDKMEKLKDDMVGINETFDELENATHEHDIVSEKRKDDNEERLNAINYRVLEIRSLATFFEKIDKENLKRRNTVVTVDNGDDENMEEDRVTDDQKADLLKMMNMQNLEKNDQIIENNEQNSQNDMNRKPPKKSLNNKNRSHSMRKLQVN